jgi:hypothetical protein
MRNTQAIMTNEQKPTRDEHTPAWAAQPRDLIVDAETLEWMKARAAMPAAPSRRRVDGSAR